MSRENFLQNLSPAKLKENKVSSKSCTWGTEIKGERSHWNCTQQPTEYLVYKSCDSPWTSSLLHSHFLCRHATLLPTNGCWKPNYIPFPLCLWSNEQTNHVHEIWQYVSRRALGSEHVSQFSTNQSIVAEFRRALCFQATKRLICKKVCFKRSRKF